YGDTQFGINKSESLKSLGIQQQRLGEDLNAGMDSFNLGLLGQAYGVQDAQIGLASQTGAFDVAQGASGTRGNEANGLVKAYAQTSFGRSVATQDEQNSQALSGMTTQATRASSDLQRERESWGSGGYRTQLYNAEDERNRQLALLQQEELQDAADQAGNPGFFDYLLGGLAGMSTGINLAGNIQDARNYSGSSGGSATDSKLGTNFVDNVVGLTASSGRSAASSGYTQNVPGLGTTYGGNPYALPGSGTTNILGTNSLSFPSLSNSFGSIGGYVDLGYDLSDPYGALGRDLQARTQKLFQ
ncbi:MAG: hypothetical protein LBS57_12610, partial [Treponema sp.]|nr:hypothetical protein [Treponema sp.]